MALIAKKQNYSGKSQIIDCMELQEIEDSTMLSAKIMGYLVLFFPGKRVINNFNCSAFYPKLALLHLYIIVTFILQ